MSEKKYLSIGEAAKAKSTSRNTIYSLLEKGKINGEEIGGRVLVVNDEAFQEVEIQHANWTRLRKLEEALRLQEANHQTLQQNDQRLLDALRGLEDRLSAVEEKERSQV